MDKFYRGLFEQAIDDWLKTEKEEGTVAKEIGWVEADLPITNMKELALGFAIGYLSASGESLLVLKKNLDPRGKEFKEDQEEIRLLIKRRIPEILECIESQLGK